MKITKFTGVALLLFTLLNAHAAPFRTDINPALLYYLGFLAAPSPLSDADEDFLYSQAGWKEKLPERAGKLLAGYGDDEFKFMRQAAQQKAPCDWGIDLSAGPETLLPHLAHAKKAAKAVELRVMWDLQNGKEAEARDDLLATMTLSRNLSLAKDSTLIAVLVEFAMENIVDATVAENFGRFSPETLQQLVDGFDAAPARGTVADEVTAEMNMHLPWLLATIQGLRDKHPGDDAAVMEGFHTLLKFIFDTPNSWTTFTNAAGGNVEGILKMVNEEAAMHPQLAKIMALPHGEFEKQLEQFSVEVQKSGNYFFAKSFPPWSRSRVKEFNIQAFQAMLRAAVAYKLRGESGLQSVMDPFGNGPFTFQRVVVKGVDRGFELKSAYAGLGYPSALLFVEKAGPRLILSGSKIGQLWQPEK